MNGFLHHIWRVRRFIYILICKRHVTWETFGAPECVIYRFERGSAWFSRTCDQDLPLYSSGLSVNGYRQTQGQAHAPHRSKTCPQKTGCQVCGYRLDPTCGVGAQGGRWRRRERHKGSNDAQAQDPDGLLLPLNQGHEQLHPSHLCQAGHQGSLCCLMGPQQGADELQDIVQHLCVSAVTHKRHHSLHGRRRLCKRKSHSHTHDATWALVKINQHFICCSRTLGLGN